MQDSVQPAAATTLARRPRCSPAANLTTADIPTLLVHGDPGVLVIPETVSWCRSHVPDLTVRNVGGRDGHFLPEDRPKQVADPLLHWITTLP